MSSNTTACLLRTTMRTSMRLILVVNFLLFIPSCVSTQTCPARIFPSEVHSPESVHKPAFVQTGFMSSIVHSFLSSVQPNPFPEELFKNSLNKRDIPDGAVNEILRYEAGFLVCVAIGILYIVLMPLIGLCFACCRCCGNCGGHMYQNQTNSINCRRRSFYWATFLITVLILAGNICMFLSNTYTHENVSSAPGEFNNTIENLQHYITTIPKQIDQVVNESLVVVDNIRDNITDIGPLLGKNIQTSLEDSLNPALDAASEIVEVVQNSSRLLSTVNATQKELDLLQSSLTEVKTSINSTLHNPACNRCVLFQSELDNIPLGLSINVSSLSELQSAVDQANSTGLSTQIQKGRNFLGNIPETVTNATRDSVKNIKQDLQSIKNQILQVTDKIPLEQLTTFSRMLGSIQGGTRDITPMVHMAEKIRWIIAIILCCLILLVVVSNLLGLVLGPVGLVPKLADPTARSSTANCGGLFFMAGVGFSFLFSWLFMIVVLILFLIGGNMYTLICVPWKTQQLFQIIDTSDVIQTLGLQINITDVYSDCQMNKSLWYTLHLEDKIDLNVYLNVSKHTGQVQKVLESTNITLPRIVLLNPMAKQLLSNFSATASRVNISSIMQKGNTQSLTSLNYIAQKLDNLSNNQTNSTIKADLTKEAKGLRNIEMQFNSSIKPLLMELDSEIMQFNDMMSHINGSVENVLKKISSAQDFLDNNRTETVKSNLAEFIDCQIRVFTVLAEWANQTITEQVGRCAPVAVTLNSVENLFCAQLVDTLNAFWFSLGWCMIFLIPSIIFSVKLAKFYRRMKYKDEFLDNMMMSPFPRVSLKSN